MLFPSILWKPSVGMWTAERPEGGVDICQPGKDEHQEVEESLGFLKVRCVSGSTDKGSGHRK